MRKIICYFGNIKPPPDRKKDVATSAGKIAIDGSRYKCFFYYGRKNIYAKINDKVGVRICANQMSDMETEKVAKIQYLLGRNCLAPMPYMYERLVATFGNKKQKTGIKNYVLKSIRERGNIKCFCIFQEHINITRYHDHTAEKFSEPIVSFKKKVKDICSKYGIKPVDLKKRNILISHEEIRCIDFDDWIIEDQSLFDNISFENTSFRI